MFPERVLAITAFCGESTFVLGTMSPSKASSAGNLYENEHCNEKQLHYQKKNHLSYYRNKLIN